MPGILAASVAGAGAYTVEVVVLPAELRGLAPVELITGLGELNTGSVHNISDIVEQ